MSKVHVGDRVRYKDRTLFSNKEGVVTVERIKGNEVQFLETGTYTRNFDKYYEVVDSTSRSDQDFKADAGKPDWSLLMSEAGLLHTLGGIVEVLDFAVRPKEQGGKGYVRHSWRDVPRAKERYRAAMFRHYAAIEAGEKLDPESGMSHWYHLGCCALFLAELEAADV